MEEQGMILEDFYIAVKRRWILILVLVLTPVLLMLFKPKGTVITEYEASTKLYVIRTDLETIADSPKGSIEYNLLNSFVQGLKSNKIIEKALEDVNSQLEVSEVASKINASIFQDSNIINISLRGRDESEVVKILQEVIKLGEASVTEYIPNSKMIDIDNIQVSQVYNNDLGVDVKKIILVLGAMTFITLLLVFTLEYLDDSFKHDEQIKQTLKERVLGVVSKKNKNVIYKKIATNIIYNNKDNKKILFASTTRKEGKKEFVIQVASNIASNNKKVLLIDLDSSTNIDDQCKTLLKNSDLEDLIIRNDYDVLNINNCELLEENIKEIIASQEEKYEYILINGMPINSGVLSQSFAKEVDGVIYIVKGYKNKRKTVLTALDELKSYNNNIIGVVLNNIEAK